MSKLVCSLKLITSQSDGLHIGKVGNVGKDLGRLRVLKGRLEGISALPLQLGTDSVGRGRAIGGNGVLDDLPALQAVLTPNALDEGHVGLQVVVLVELEALLIGVHDSEVVNHLEVFGGEMGLE